MWVVSIVAVTKTIALELSVFVFTFVFGNTFNQVMFDSRYYITRSSGHFLYEILWKPHLVRLLTVCMRLSKWTSYSYLSTILTSNGLNAFSTASKSFMPTTVSILIWRAINNDTVVFRALAFSVAPHPYIFIMCIGFILNDVIKRNIWPWNILLAVHFGDYVVLG